MQEPPPPSRAQAPLTLECRVALAPRDQCTPVCPAPESGRYCTRSQAGYTVAARRGDGRLGGDTSAFLCRQRAPPPSTRAPNLLLFFFFPQNANHNLIAPKQTCISRTQAQPRGRLWPHGRQVGLPKQDGAGSVTSQALYESPERTRQGVSGDDVPRTLPAGVNAQRQRPVSPCRVTRAGGSGPS